MVTIYHYQWPGKVLTKHCSVVTESLEHPPRDGTHIAEGTDQTNTSFTSVHETERNVPTRVTIVVTLLTMFKVASEILEVIAIHCMGFVDHVNKDERIEHDSNQREHGRCGEPHPERLTP